MAKTKIEWVINPDGTKGETWNPISGCSKTSDGCAHCYAEAMTRRFDKYWMPWTAQNAGHNVKLHPERLDQPLRWRKPRRIFVCSMGDLFHEEVPDHFVDRIFGMMALSPEHIFLVLTKRAKAMWKYLTKDDRSFCVEQAGWFHEGYSRPIELASWPLSNVGIGVSIENQRTADERMPLLFQTPAAWRFISGEPLLDNIDFGKLIDCPKCGGCGYIGEKMCLCCVENSKGWTPGKVPLMNPLLHGVIVGGESGPKARPMNPAWPRSIRDQCQAAGVPFFFKQHGEFVGQDDIPASVLVNYKGLECDFPDNVTVYRVGKKAAGRELDGRTWEEMPK